MSRDIVERLRDRAYSGLPDPLLAEAADEIERLRNGALLGRETVTLTDAEPEAAAVGWLRSMPSSESLANAATLLFLFRRGAVSEETAVRQDEFGEFEDYVEDTISRIMCLLDGGFKADEQ